MWYTVYEFQRLAEDTLIRTLLGFNFTADSADAAIGWCLRRGNEAIKVVQSAKR